MSHYDEGTVQDYIDIDIIEYDLDVYRVDYELYDGSARYGVRFISDYEIKKVIKNDVEIKKVDLSAYARNCVELAIESKHRQGISCGIGGYHGASSRHGN